MKTISVVITTYNQESFISKCIESILMQQGDFLLEVVIGDDHSTDGTRKIIERYQQKNPNIIKVISGPENIGMQQNLKRCLDYCSGDYVAVCEGDDYWTDPGKLNKQMRFLDANPDCSMCFNSILLFIEKDGNSFQHIEHKYLTKGRFSTEDLIASNFIGNFSCCMYRTSVISKLPEKLFQIKFADWLFNLCCSQFGPIGYLSEMMSVYRIHEKGVWSRKTLSQQNKAILRSLSKFDLLSNHRFSETIRKNKNQIRKDTIPYTSADLLVRRVIEKTLSLISTLMIKTRQFYIKSTGTKNKPSGNGESLYSKYYRKKHDSLVSMITTSGFFNEKWYLARYPQVRISGFYPAIHYLLDGGFSGYDPGPDFNSSFYLDAYPDVKQAQINPLVHYLKYGIHEGRIPRPGDK